MAIITTKFDLFQKVRFNAFGNEKLPLTGEIVCIEVKHMANFGTMVEYTIDAELAGKKEAWLVSEENLTLIA